MWYIFLGVLTGLGLLIYYKAIKPAKYWQKRNIPHEPPLFGTISNALLRRKHVSDIITNIYTKHHGRRFVGLQFKRPTLMIRDVGLINQLGENSEHFDDHFSLESSDFLSPKSLGRKWQQLRSSLTSVFTETKIRSMYEQVAECANDFVRHFKTKESVAVQIKDVFSRFALDVVASTAFGVRTNSPDNPNMKKFGWLQVLAKLIRAQVFPIDISDLLKSIVKDSGRKHVRPDLIQLMVQDEDTAAQTVMFFFAGLHTLSTAASFMAYELAVHPDVQKKLQEEIDAVHEEKISYETLTSMKYLDQVVSETLRLWPPMVQLERACSKDFAIPPKTASESEVLIEKGVSVMVPVIALHRDDEYFPEAERFDPERFNEENITKIKPGTYIPFGLEPKNCIGSRFALLELKTLFVYLLSKLDIVPLDETQIPLKINLKGTNLQPEAGFKLGFRPRKTTFY